MPKRIEYQGTIHEFPDEFTDADIAAALQSMPAPPKEAKSVGGFLGNLGTDLKENVTGALSMLDPRTYLAADRAKAQESARIEADPQSFEQLKQSVVGEGFSPARAGAAAAALPGQMADFAYEKPVTTAMMAQPLAGLRRAPMQQGPAAMATPKSGPLAVVPLEPIKQGLDQFGNRLIRGGLKLNTGQLNQMPGVKQLGLDAKAEQVARVAQDVDVNPGTRQGLQTIQGQLDVADDLYRGDIASVPQVPIPGSGVERLRAVGPVAAKYGPANQTFSEADLATIRALYEEMRRNPATSNTITLPSGARMTVPRDLTPMEVYTNKKGDNRALQEQMGKVGDAAIDTRKAVVATGRDQLERTVPGTSALGRRMQGLIDLRNASNIMRKRADNRDVVGLTDLINLSAGRPENLILSTAMRPAAQAGLGLALTRTGRRLPSNVDLTDLYRMALLSQLSQTEGPD